MISFHKNSDRIFHENPGRTSLHGKPGRTSVHGDSAMISFSEIIREKNKSLQKTKELKPLKELKIQIENIDTKKSSNKSFKESITHDEDVCVICEYKPASPSQGIISDVPLKEALEVFINTGASAISILTDETFFRSGLNNLKSAFQITELPLLRKDFLLDEYQIYEAKAGGASAVLLMTQIYPDLRSGIDLCNHLELDVLVECRNRDEIDQALKAGTQIIGINNRSFEDFSVDLKRTQKLRKNIPEEVVVVSESGVKGPKDAKLLASYGVDALLVGTGIMKINTKVGMFEASRDIISAVKRFKV